MSQPEIDAKVERKFNSCWKEHQDDIVRDSGHFMHALINHTNNDRDMTLAGACHDAVIWRRVCGHQEEEIQHLRFLLAQKSKSELPNGI